MMRRRVPLELTALGKTFLTPDGPVVAVENMHSGTERSYTRH